MCINKTVAGFDLTPKEANLTYLMMARSMIAIDRAAAIRCLGLSEQSADAMLRLSAAELMQMAPRASAQARPAGGGDERPACYLGSCAAASPAIRPWDTAVSKPLPER